jgi:hypothetical protein
MSLQKNIQDALNAQDVELANALNEMKANPSKLSDFISTRKADLYNTVSREHSDSFQKVYGDLQRSSDTTKNILYYHVRNKDLDSLQQQIFNTTKTSADNAQYDSQVARRQFQINEWTVGNKQDTLFFMQMLFIGLTLIAPLLYMNRGGMVPDAVFYGVVGLVILAIVLTVIVRAQYTNKTRNQTFWNRRRFQSMGGPPVTPTCDAVVGALSRGADAAASLGSTNMGDTLNSALTATGL